MKRSIEDLAQNKPKADPSLNESVNLDYNFKPQSFTKKSVWSKRVESNLNVSRIDHALEVLTENKENKLNQIKKELELQELSQCSFKPKITKNLSKSSTQVDVRGMNSYMENVNRKKKLDEMKEERKKQVFGIAEGGSLKTYY